MTVSIRYWVRGSAWVLAATVYAGAALAADPSPAAPPPDAAATSASAAAAPCPAPQAVFEAGQRPEGMIPPRIAVWPIVPPYPANLPKGQTGIVSADYTVRLDGTACNIQVKVLQGPQEFAASTMQWLSTMPFAPATKNSQPIPAEMKRLFRLGTLAPTRHMQSMHFQAPTNPMLPHLKDTPDEPDTPDDK